MSKKVPPIVQIGAWTLSLIVFIVGFWHTYLGLKEMKPFGSEWGGLAIAGIVLLLLLITYWFAVNGNKAALVFYLFCGFIFFICNLNYFYPAYMARTLVQNEAGALSDTLQKYTNGSSSMQSSENSQAVKEYLNLTSLKGQIVTEIENKGYGPNAKQLTDKFNSILSKYSVTPINVSAAVGSVTTNAADAQRQKEQIEPLFAQAMNSLMLQGVLKVFDPSLFQIGLDSLKNLQKKYTGILNAIKADNKTEYKLDSIKINPNVQSIVNFVGDLNTTIDKINKGNNKEKAVLTRLDEDTHPRADKLGMIKYTMLSIKERISEIDTWAIIFLCLFIDLIVPLAIYLLLRKKENDEFDEVRVTSPDTF